MEKIYFIEQMGSMVCEYAPAYDIKACSAVIAQACLESGFGNTRLAEDYHNYFGLKCGSKWTGSSVNMKTQEEYTPGEMTTITDSFRAYSSMKEGVKGYFEFIQLARYQNLRGVSDPEEYLQKIVGDGYCTDSKYVGKCMALINQYNLKNFDGKEGALSLTVFDRQKVISLARQEEGYLEKSKAHWDKYGAAGLYDKTAGAGYDNYTKYGYEMHRLYPSVMDFPAPWCDSGVDWLFMQAYGTANAKKLLGGDFDDYTVASAQLYKDKGAWKPAGTVPEPGWQVFFKNSTRICHTGLALEVVEKDGKKYVVTWEGNTSSKKDVDPNGGSTRIKQYPVDYASIAGYGVPPYGNGYAAAKIEFVPHWVASDGKWYYRVADNENAHGFRDINGHRYYFDEKGEMASGWREINGNWYFFHDNNKNGLEGAMYYAPDGIQKIFEV